MSKSRAWFLFLLLSGVACSSDTRLYDPGVGAGQNSPDDKFGVSGGLQAACAKGDLGVNEDNIIAALYEADGLRQQGMSEEQAAAQMQLGCTYTCPDLASWNECQSICEDCVAAILNQVYD